MRMVGDVEDLLVTRIHSRGNRFFLVVVVVKACGLVLHGLTPYDDVVVAFGLDR